MVATTTWISFDRGVLGTVLCTCTILLLLLTAILVVGFNPTPRAFTATAMSDVISFGTVQ